MEASQISDILLKKIAFISGGQDHENCPIVTFPAHGDDFPQQEIVACVSYLKNILVGECDSKTITVIIDTRYDSWKQLKLLLKIIQSISSNVNKVFIVKPEHFWDKQKISLDIKKGKTEFEFEVVFLSVHKLIKYISKSNLTPDVGGSLNYDHQQWLKVRLDFEKFHKKSQNLIKNMDILAKKLSSEPKCDVTESSRKMLANHQQLNDEIVTQPQAIIQEGTGLLKQWLIEADSGFHNSESVHSINTINLQVKIRQIISSLHFKQEKLQIMWERRLHELKCDVEFEDLEKGMKKVIDWIIGPARKLFAAQNIGTCLQTAEECLKQHEQLESICSDYLSNYKKLCGTAESLLAERYFSRTAIQTQKNYMDKVFRDFVKRLDNRRHLLMITFHFYELVDQFSKQMDNLLELLCCDITVSNIESAENALSCFAFKFDSITCLMEKIHLDGQAVIDLLGKSSQNKSSDILSLRKKQVDCIQKVITNQNERKCRARKLVDVRQLKLQQILQLKTCEYDADQAIKWIIELHDVLIKTHTDIGKNLNEVNILKIEHNKFKETAVNTFEYGKQLLQAASVLRRACRQDLLPISDTEQKLQEAWEKLSVAIDKREDHLNSS